MDKYSFIDVSKVILLEISFDQPEKGTEAQLEAACDVWKERHYTFQHSEAV